MVDMENDERILERKNVRPTANRLLVLRAMQGLARPVSLPELEMIVAPMDRSSIFRVLGLFVEHHVAHAIEDGSGMLKYELCSGEYYCTLSDMHAHFYCEICHQTYCFKTTHIPEICLPDGFTMKSINYMVKGICARCGKKPRLRDG